MYVVNYYIPFFISLQALIERGREEPWFDMRLSETSDIPRPFHLLFSLASPTHPSSFRRSHSQSLVSANSAAHSVCPTPSLLLWGCDPSYNAVLCLFLRREEGRDCPLFTLFGDMHAHVRKHRGFVSFIHANHDPCVPAK